MCTGTIRVMGMMVVENDTKVTTSRIEVENTGSVSIGTPESPASNVTLYLNHNDCEGLVGGDREENWNSDAAECLKRGEILIRGNWHSYGVPVTSWTRLIDDWCQGCDQMKVEECRGWKVGDEVAITGSYINKRSESSPNRRIASIQAGQDGRNCIIGIIAEDSDTCWVDTSGVAHIDQDPDTERVNEDPHCFAIAADSEREGREPLCPRNSQPGRCTKHSGGPISDTEVYGSTYRAEVLHFARSIVITGPMHWRDGGTNSADSPRGGQGIITRAIDNGEVVMHYHQMSNCGRVLLGSYCHHLHHRNQAGGEFKGISVRSSVSKAFTIHGTSGARVEAASIYNHRGAAIYLEVSITTLTRFLTKSLTLCSTKHGLKLENVGGPQNGAEHSNLIMGNAIACEIRSYHAVPGQNLCALLDGVNSQNDGDKEDQAGIYMMGMHGAAIIGNAISGQDNALFVNQKGASKWGRDIACKNVAPTAQTMVMQKNNVFHDNYAFGWYSNSHSMLRTIIDEETGYVTDWSAACPWDFNTRQDNAHRGILENHVEYGNNFGMGTYHMSDFSCKNCTIIGNLAGIYWKTFWRSRDTPPVMDGGRLAGLDPNNPVRLPGGQGLVELKDVEIVGDVLIGFNHHCDMNKEITGGMCASSYFLNNAINTGGWNVRFYDATCLNEAPCQNYGGHTSMVFQNGIDLTTKSTLIMASGQPTFDPLGVGCDSTTSNGRPAFWCPGSLKIRPLLIYSPDRGVLTVTSTHDQDNGGMARTTLIHKRNKITDNGQSLGAYYCPVGRNSANGYTMQVLDGAKLEIRIDHAASLLNDAEYKDFFVMHYSEEQWPDELKSHIEVTVTGVGALYLNGGPFQIHSDHDRAFMTPFGAYVSEAGAWWHAMNNNGDTSDWSQLSTFTTAEDYESERVQWVNNELSNVCEYR